MSTFIWDFPVVITAQGLQPQTPAALNAQVKANLQTNSPGATASLPGSLISDMTGTVTGAISVMDQAKVEAVNSLTPYGANVFLLGKLGQLYLGQSQPGLATNTTGNVVFTSPDIGYVIPNGFLIGDGTHAYQVQVGGVIGSGGTSEPVTAVAVQPGSWAVPANTVTALLSSVPSTITLSVSNPLAGTPAGQPETWGSFRARVLTAGFAACVSGPRLIKTFIGALLGAAANLISVQQASPGLRVVVGGNADVYAIANAIFMAVANPAVLQGSAISGGRNVSVSLTDYPDTYPILFVQMPVQVVTLEITWKTTLSDFTGGPAFPGLVQQPLANYINSLAGGQPINELQMDQIFQQAVQGSLDSSLLSAIDYTVTIDGTITAPSSGTSIVVGDPESSWEIQPSDIAVTQA